VQDIVAKQERNQLVGVDFCVFVLEQIRPLLGRRSSLLTT